MMEQKKTPNLGGGRAHSNQSDEFHNSTRRRGMHPKPTGAWAVYAALSQQQAADDVRQGKPSAYYDSIVTKPADHYSIDTALAEAMREMYGSPVELKGRGQWQRFKPPGKKELDGFASVLGIDRAVFGIWGHDRHLVVLSEDDEKDQTEEQREKARMRREKAERDRQARRLAEARRNAQAAAIAQSKAPFLPLATTHEYTSRKGLKPLGLRQEGTNLVAFLTDGHGIVGYQTISPTGEKRFLTGTAKQGAYWPLGHVKDYIGVCEGVGTAIAVHMGFGCAVAAAMDAGNLKAVCLSLRKRHPNTPIIVYADNDHGPNNDREDNPGVRLGKEAAAAVGGHCVWPSARLGHKGTDFADLWLECPWYFDAGVTV